MNRRGFALIGTLWAVTLAGVLAVAASLVGREYLHASRNRAGLEVARWAAEACLAHARSHLDGLFEQVAGPEAAVALWRALGARVDHASMERPGCHVTLEAKGSRLDVNLATSEQLVRALAPHVGADSAARLADALLDWRDADDEPRPGGAEAAWYREQGRHLPRNDSLADVRELRRVRGFDSLAVAHDLLAVGEGPVSLANAPAEVLRSLPGFVGETVAALVDLRERGEHVVDLAAFASRLSSEAADSLVQRLPELQRVAVLEPRAWTLRSEGRAGTPGVSARIEVTLVQAGRRLLVLERRGWL